MSETPARTIRVAAYCRYSSLMQADGYSLPAQHDAITKDGEDWLQAKREAWQVTWYDEPATSAKHEKLHLRVRFAELLRDVEAHRFDLVVVHKLNRLARHLTDQMTTVSRIAAAGCGVHSVVEHPDFATATGRLVANIMGSVAQYFVEDLGEEVKKGMAARAREDGLPVHRLAFGYRWPGGATSGRAASGPPEHDCGDTWEGYLLLKRLLLAGYTQQETADRLNAEGKWTTGGLSGKAEGGRFTRETVRAIRANVFYRPWQPGDERGTVRHKGNTYRGAHLAACTWDEWHSMQQLASGRKHGYYRPPAGGADHLEAEFRGIVACAACADHIGHMAYVRHTWSGRLRGQGYRHDYYRCDAERRGDVCSDQGHYARAEDVRAAWMDWLRANVRLPDDWQERLRARAHAAARLGGDLLIGSDAERRLVDERRMWTEKRRRIIELYRDLFIERDERDAKVAEADRELARITAQRAALHGLSAPGETDSASVVRLLDAGKLVSELADDWLEMTPDERTRMAAVLLEPRGGLVVRLYGHGQTTRHLSKTCVLETVRLRPIFRELLMTVEQSMEVAV